MEQIREIFTPEQAADYLQVIKKRFIVISAKESLWLQSLAANTGFRKRALTFSFGQQGLGRI
jgi:hypothetical protein